MASGNTSSGNPYYPYGTGSARSWSGADDPLKQAWNEYYTTGVDRFSAYCCTPPPYVTCGQLAGSGTLPVAGWDSNDENKLLDKFFKAYRGHEFNAGVFIGQSRELASQIIGTTNALVHGFRALKRGHLDAAVRSFTRTVSGLDRNAARRRLHSGDLAGAWLALQYGWLPTYHDVQSAALALEALARPPRTWTIEGRHSKIVTGDVSLSPSLYTVGAKAIRSHRIVYEMKEELSFERSLGLTDVSSVVWELVPWSFVVDWFVPIGTYLSNLAMLPAVSGVIKRTSKYSSSGWQYSSHHEAYTGCNTACFEYAFQRHPLGLLAVPPPRFKGIDQLWTSATRTANALALMRSVFDPDPDSLLRKRGRRG